MFQFRPFPSYAYLIQRTITEYCSVGFPHSEIHGYNGYLLLPVAYRSLSRPSSAPDAKAFPLRSFQLDLLEIWFSIVELCRQFYRIFEIVIVTLHLLRCCPQLKLFLKLSFKTFCCLAYHFFFALFSFQGTSPGLETGSKYSSPLEYFDLSSIPGGDSRDRTGDLLLARQALSQLSYIPNYLTLSLFPGTVPSKLNNEQVRFQTSDQDVSAKPSSR